MAKKGNIITKPEDIVKQPTVLEFLGMEEKTKYSETDLETAIIDKLQKFLLEMGKGYLFESRQNVLPLMKIVIMLIWCSIIVFFGVMC